MEEEKKGVFKDPQFLLGLFGGIAVVAIIGLIILGIVVINLARNPGSGGEVAGTNDANNGDQAAQGVALSDIKALFDQDTLKFGKASAKNLIVEASDPSCPYCHIAGGKNPELNKQVGTQFLLKADGGTYVAPVPEIKKLVDSGKAAFVYLFFPGHGNGELAAQSFYCAYEKNKFWEAHDLLMSAAGYSLMNDGAQPTAESISTFLKSVVDEAFMKDCLSSGKYASKLTRDTNVAQQFGVQGTPGFFINTTRFDGAYGYTDMASAVK